MLNILQFFLKSKDTLLKEESGFSTHTCAVRVSEPLGVLALGSWNFFRLLPAHPIGLPQPAASCPGHPALGLCVAASVVCLVSLIDSSLWSRISRLTSAFSDRAQLWDLPRASCSEIPLSLPHIQPRSLWARGRAPLTRLPRVGRRLDVKSE